MVEAITKRVTYNGSAKVYPREKPDIACDPIDRRSAQPATECLALILARRYGRARFGDHSVYDGTSTGGEGAA